MATTRANGSKMQQPANQLPTSNQYNNYEHDNSSHHLLEDDDDDHELLTSLDSSTGSPHRKQPRRESESSVFDDGTNSFFWRAHSFSVLVIVVSTLYYVVFVEQQPPEWDVNLKRGILASSFVFLAFGITQAKDGPFIRPHPVLWRLLLCVSVLYELGLVFLLFQTRDVARQLLTFLDKRLNVEIDFTAYGNECDLWDRNHSQPLHNVLDKMDGFVPAHFFGWFFKTMILRDIWLATMISFGFELLEYTFEHQLANFSECWWDHWLLDFLLCNGLGIYFGMLCCKHLSIKTYKWRGLFNIPSYKGKLTRVFAQFGPYSWVRFSWKPTENLYRWFYVSFVIFFFLLAELNTFYLKFVLWVPPENPLVLSRLCFFMFWGAVSVREAYDYGNGRAKTFGQQAWITCIIIITESMIVAKFGQETLLKPFPPHVKYAWLLMLLVYVTWSVWKFQMRFPRVKLFWRACKQYYLGWPAAVNAGGGELKPSRSCENSAEEN